MRRLIRRVGDIGATLVQLSASVAETITGAWTFSTAPSIANPTITGDAPATPTANVLYRDLIPKGWVQFTVAAGIVDDVNVSSITDTGAGDWTVNWATAFANANYAVSVTYHDDTVLRRANIAAALGTTTTRIRIFNEASTPEDPTGNIYVIAIGDQ